MSQPEKARLTVAELFIKELLKQKSGRQPGWDQSSQLEGAGWDLPDSSLARAPADLEAPAHLEGGDRWPCLSLHSSPSHVPSRD